jgi:predicted PurR-regulated permease PerM
LVTFAYAARAVVLPVLMAWVVSMTLKPLVRWLRTCHVPTPLGAGLVVTALVVVLGNGVMRLGSPAIEWIQAAPENVPLLKEKFKHVLRPAVRLSEAASSVSNLDPAEDTAKKAQPVEVKNNSVPTTVFSWTGSLLAGIGETIALVFLLLVTGDVLVQKLVRVMPTLRDKKQAQDISHEIQLHISRYLFSVGLVNVCFGVVVGLVFHLLGMPNAMMWGSVAALVNFIPYFGPVVGMIAVGLAGLFAFDTLGQALLPASAYLILHLVEANVVTPFVLGRRFMLNPVIIFVTLIFCIWLWGVTGALLAMPLLVTLKVVCERVPSLATVGELLSSQNSKP